MRRSHLCRAAAAVWLALLLLPNVTTAARANAWDFPAWQLLVAGVWMAAFAWSMLPPRLLLALSLPLLAAGIAVFAADILCSVDALELVSVSYTFGRHEVAQALRPFAGLAAIVGVVLVAMLVLLWRHPHVVPRAGAATRLALAGAGAVLAFSLHAASWQGAWPVALATAALEARLGLQGIGVPDLEDVRANPRDRFDTWGASREAAPDAPETYLLVIGESVRSDRVPGCGGRAEVTPAPAGALVFCDVLAGASGTHVSVPLLVGRQLPGLRQRVPREATLLKAFEAVGFETFWLSTQETLVAWPDGRNMAFAPGGRDREVLLPMLQRALASPARRKMIVLHAYNAHFPYEQRYDAALAPFPVDRGRLQAGRVSRAHIDQWWNDYDNAVDESMRFLQEVVTLLRAQQGESFLLYTPDHGENLLDDARGLSLHALKTPTLWDTTVPGIAWANEPWRARQPGKWEMLARNRGAALMHMDFAPTLLGAANIRYAEPRKEPVDLTAAGVPRRARFTHLRPGEAVPLERLQLEAGRSAPAATAASNADARPAPP